MARRHWLASLAVVACIGLQASTFVTATWCWPFLVYGMYVNSHHPPVRTANFTVIALLDDGTRIVVDQYNTVSATGLGFFAWVLDFVCPAMEGKPNAAERLVGRLRLGPGAAVQSVEILKDEYELTDDGLVVRHVRKGLDLEVLAK